MNEGKPTVERAFLVLLGPSGVGKSTQMEALPLLDDRFVRIRAYTTRPVRRDEDEKLTVSAKEFRSMEADGAFAVVNSNYGHRYGTPRHEIQQVLESGRFPVMDFPWERLPALRSVFADAVFAVYMAPPSIDELRERLASRKDANRRLAQAAEELARLRREPVTPIVDAQVVVDGTPAAVAILLRTTFLEQ